jgi:ABC-type glycerol-3-phosphate transport system substrate-binding protein
MSVTRNARWLQLVIALALLVVVALLVLTGCDVSPAQPTPVAGVPTATPQPTALPTEATLPQPTVLTITLWTTEAFSPTQAITSGQILAAEAASFEALHPDVRLQFVPKKPYGKGGILDFLVTTGAVVPDLLPDLVLIDVDELNAAVQAGLLQPLDDLVPVDLVADLYPFARDAATFDGRLYALQLWADLDHLVYNTGKITIPPRSWPGVLSNPGPYIFPAGGQAGLVNDAFWVQYLAVKGSPAGGTSQDPFLEESPLVAVLQFYQDGVSQGVLPAGIVDYHTTDECWRDYLAGKAVMTQVSAHRYLLDRDQLQSSAVAGIPAINGPASAIGRGWALALVTSDPAHQVAAIDFMVQLLAPELNAAWARASSYLPTRQSALATWDGADSYTRFMEQQLQAARARPLVPGFAQGSAALQGAVEAVVNGASSPEEAAIEALESGP